VAFFHVAEVNSVDPRPSLVREDGRLGVSKEGPLGGAEEGMSFYVGGASAGAEAAEFVFCEEFADGLLAEPVMRVRENPLRIEVRRERSQLT
jgi:hypothetical protein